MERPQLPKRLQDRRLYKSSPPAAVGDGQESQAFPTLKPAENNVKVPPPLPPPPPRFPKLVTEKVEVEPAREVLEPVRPAEEPISVTPPQPARIAPEEETYLPVMSQEDDSEAVNFMRMRKSSRKGLVKKEAKRWKRRGVIAALSVGIPAALILTMFQFNTIPSNSMSPTVGHNDFLVSFRFAPHNVQTGDIVIFNGKGTDWGNENFLKRVIGVSGDSVSCCEEGEIVVNGERMPEPYILDPESPASSAGFNVEVAPDSFFALGDNRSNSKDSRYFFDQSVPLSSVIAIPFLGFNLSEFRFYSL